MDPRRPNLSDIAADYEQRRLPDRRKRPTPMISRYTLLGRRKGFRRDEESSGSYVDRYGAKMTGILVAIVSLSLLDAFFTLLYIGRGGEEWNPLMKLALDAGIGPFLAIKCGMTVLGVLFLCLHKNFRFVKILLNGVLVIYGALLVYHLFLAFMV